MTDREKPKPFTPSVQLGPTKTGDAASWCAALAGLLPMAGPSIQYALMEFIVGKRMSRIERFVHELYQYVDQELFLAQMKDPVRCDVVEEGMGQAARAYTEDRVRHLVHLVSKGTQGDDHAARRTQHFLRLLPQLDDVEIILLTSVQWAYQDPRRSPAAADFWERHRAILGTTNEKGENTFTDEGGLANYKVYMDHLYTMCLVGWREDADKTLELYDTTVMGADLLRFLDLLVE